jgi:signal transduction histidine kinase
MSDKIAFELFAALNYLVLQRIDVGYFKILGNLPNWINHFCPRKIESGMNILIQEEGFPFIENFLIDAEEFWQENQEKPLESGLWVSLDLYATEHYFEASAICINNQKILLIELVDDFYKEKQQIIQKARENQLSYQQILKETQKKDVLIHCIIHDIAGQLSGINCCLALLELENLTPKGRERLDIGRRQSIKQEILIREILDAFSAEINSLESFTVNIESAPDILKIAQEIIQLLTPNFNLNKIQLKLINNLNDEASSKVVGDKSRLERVITNLVENAYRYSPSESTVTIVLEEKETSIFVYIDDEGNGVPNEFIHSLFKKFSQAHNKPGKVGLGLYFCRITIERWGGKIGYSPRPQGGSRFWFSLPKAL